MNARTILLGAAGGAAVGLAYALMRGNTAVAAPSSSATPIPKSPGLPGGTVPGTSTPPPRSPTVPTITIPDAEGQAFFDQLSTDPSTRSRQLLEALRQRVYGGDIPSSDIEVTDDVGNSAVVTVSTDAVKLYGVRINIDQYNGQLAADHYDSVMMTQKIADEIWKNARYKPTPTTAGEMGFSLSVMEQTPYMLMHSMHVDRKLAELGWNADTDHNTLVANVGKDWLLNDWFWLPGRNVQHCKRSDMSGSVPNSKSSVNYGWFAPRAMSGYSSNGHGLYIIQNAANCHGYTHVDYSQVLRLISGTMIVNGTAMRTADVMTSSQYAGLLLYGGVPLPAARHPNVPLFSGGVLV